MIAIAIAIPPMSDYAGASLIPAGARLEEDGTVRLQEDGTVRVEES